MNEPIKVGDMVVVIKPNHCKCYQKSLGRIFTVEAIYDDGRKNWCCPDCGSFTPKLVGESRAAKLSNGSRYGLHRLKRIPPLDELEGVDEKETLHA